MSSRLEKWVGEVASCTSRSACVWPVPLATVPLSVTVAPGPANCGFIEVMVNDTRPVPAACTGVASAGAASASTAVAAMAAAAASDRVCRLNFAASTLCTPRMLLPFAPNPCDR